MYWSKSKITTLLNIVDILCNGKKVNFLVAILKIIYGYNNDSIFVYSDNKYVLIGRNSLGSEAYFKLNAADKYISRNHCLIEKVENKYYLLDNSSLNDTFLVQRDQANFIQIKCSVAWYL